MCAASRNRLSHVNVGWQGVHSCALAACLTAPQQLPFPLNIGPQERSANACQTGIPLIPMLKIAYEASMQCTDPIFKSSLVI